MFESASLKSRNLIIRSGSKKLCSPLKPGTKPGPKPKPKSGKTPEEHPGPIPTNKPLVKPATKTGHEPLHTSLESKNVPMKKGNTVKSAIQKRTYDDDGKYPSQFVPADDAWTQYVDMGSALYGRPGSWLWTHGLASCIGVAIYGEPPNDPYNGGKILAHISGGTYMAQLGRIDALAAQHEPQLTPKVIVVVAPNTQQLPADWDPNLRAPLERMIDDVWRHLATQYPQARMIPYHHITNYNDRNGEMVINYVNQVYLDGVAEYCIN
jgi:hypothetical protein